MQDVGSEHRSRTRKCQDDDFVEKAMLSADFSRTGFVSIEFLQGQNIGCLLMLYPSMLAIVSFGSKIHL
jgi:hypothetical protein